MIVLPMDFVPALQRAIQMIRLNSNQESTNGAYTWIIQAALIKPGTEALMSLTSHACCPVRDGLVTAGSAKDSFWLHTPVRTSVGSAGLGHGGLGCRQISGE